MIDWKSNRLDVYLWDVGHGLSVTFITPYVQNAAGVDIKRRRVIQIDLGVNNEYNFCPIRHLVEKRGLSKIDYLIVTHPDQDHINDMVNVDELRNEGKLEIIRFRRNHSIPNNEISENALIESEAKTIYKQMHNEYMGQHLPHQDVNPATFAGLDICTRCLNFDEGMDINDASVVSNILFGKTQFLIPGDLSKDGFDKLITCGMAPVVIDNAVRILVAPHHGRESAEADYLVDYYKPHLVLASAKEEDEYTDSMYSQSNNISGYSVKNDNGEFVNHKFLATKGQLIGISVENTHPVVQKISYK